MNTQALGPFAMALGPLAVVDLETTGLSDEPEAEILEFGVVLLDPGSDQLTTLQSLVRPHRPLPASIERITGLRDEDVEKAPELEEVAPTVRAALAGRAIIAHNAAFERRFLAEFVSPELAAATYLDTQDLLALTHPDAPDLRLESFTRMLLGHEERHRALDDALDTLRVISTIAEGARSGEPRTLVARRALERYAPDSPWLLLLGSGLAVDDSEPPSPFISIPASHEKPVPFDEDAICKALGDEARGRRYFPGYRVRAEQIALAREFVRSFSQGKTLLLEGGTGVGKSLAYLAAAIPFALEREAGGIREPLVVSTRTKLLQDQLLGKDIAAAAAFLGHSELRALSIKGRANYVCARRVDGVLAEGRELSMFTEDRLAYAVLLACARTRPHGEVGSIPGLLLRRYPALRELLRRSVAVRAEQCTREECGSRPDCPFGRRRAALGKAHLVVANHDLLLRWPPDYPSFTHVVIDEGHELAGVADEVYAIGVSPQEILEQIDDLFGRAGDRRRGVEALLPERARRVVGEEARARRRELQLDFAAIGRSLAERATEYGEVQLPAFADRIFPKTAELAQIAAARLDHVAGAAEAAMRQGEQGRDDEDEPGPSSALQRTIGELRLAARGLRLAFSDERYDEVVSAFERLEPPYDRWRLAIRAVCPAEPFHERFLQKLESFAVVSASIFVAGDPGPSLGELEIEERSLLPVRRVSVESPFPYAEHMRVVALDEEAERVEATAAVIGELARALGGRTLGLFTSLRRMERVAELLGRELRADGIDVLAPRRASDDPSALVQRFCRSRGGGVLLGARTFWQGLDIPGGDLQAVVIEKLPFEVPTELRRRRELRLRALGEDAFERFTVGKMLLYLKQMTGRLIRSEEDRGIVVIVESRRDRPYSARLADALPPETEIRRLDGWGEITTIMAEVGLGPLQRSEPCDLRDSES